MGRKGKKWERSVKLMFYGTYQYGIDDKGRISIPNEFRKKLDSEIIVSCGLEPCLIIYTIEDWNRILEKTSALSFTKEKNREFNRLFYSGAYSKDLDNKGRISLEKMQIEYASLSKDCVFVGTGARIEIWDKKAWDELNKTRTSKISRVSEEIDLV